MTTQNLNQNLSKIIEDPNIPKYVIENLEKNLVAEIYSYSQSNYLYSGIKIYKTRKGYAILMYYQTYCTNKFGIIMKCIRYTYGAFKVKSTELYDYLKWFLMKWFDVNEKGEYCYEVLTEDNDTSIVCKEDSVAKKFLEALPQFVEAIINNKQFVLTEGKYAGCIFPSCYVNYAMYTKGENL